MLKLTFPDGAKSKVKISADGMETDGEFSLTESGKPTWKGFPDGGNCQELVRDGFPSER